MSLARIWMSAVSAVPVLAAAATPALAHHSFAAEFDANLPVSIAGVVTRVDWRNPHIWIYVDATDDDGRVTHWEVEGGAPNSLMRAGFGRNSLKVGDRVTVDGFRAYHNETIASMLTVTGADGKTIFTELTERALERPTENTP